MGYDPLQIAAIALKMARARRSSVHRSGHRNRGQAIAKKPTRRQTRSKNNGIMSSKKGMVRLTLSAGKSQGLQPTDVVGTIAFRAKYSRQRNRPYQYF